MLIDGGADPNMADDENDTPLTCASTRGCTDLVKLLLDKGADPNVSHVTDPGNGSTALMCAVVNGHKEIVRLLLEKGAQPNVKEGTTEGYTGCTPSHLAAIFGHKDNAQMILYVHMYTWEHTIQKAACTINLSV